MSGGRHWQQRARLLRKMLSLFFSLFFSPGPALSVFHLTGALHPPPGPLRTTSCGGRFSSTRGATGSASVSPRSAGGRGRLPRNSNWRENGRLSSPPAFRETVRSPSPGGMGFRRRTPSAWGWVHRPPGLPAAAPLVPTAAAFAGPHSSRGLSQAPFFPAQTSPLFSVSWPHPQPSTSPTAPTSSASTAGRRSSIRSSSRGPGPRRCGPSSCSPPSQSEGRV